MLYYIVPAWFGFRQSEETLIGVLEHEVIDMTEK